MFQTLYDSNVYFASVFKLRVLSCVCLCVGVRVHRDFVPFWTDGHLPNKNNNNNNKKKGGGEVKGTEEEERVRHLMSFVVIDPLHPLV